MPNPVAPAETMSHYFTEAVEYPLGRAHDLAATILPPGELWTYVSSSFLNGWANVGTPVHCVVLNRYRGLDVVTDDDMNPLAYRGVCYPTKRQLLAAFMADPDPFHVKLSLFDDDVLLVNRVGPDDYLYLWFDCDVSDCCIGRFQANSESAVLPRLIATAAESGANHGFAAEAPTVIAVERLRGWLSF